MVNKFIQNESGDYTLRYKEFEKQEEGGECITTSSLKELIEIVESYRKKAKNQITF